MSAQLKAVNQHYDQADGFKPNDVHCFKSEWPKKGHGELQEGENQFLQGEDIQSGGGVRKPVSGEGSRIYTV